MSSNAFVHKELSLFDLVASEKIQVFYHVSGPMRKGYCRR